MVPVSVFIIILLRYCITKVAFWLFKLYQCIKIVEAGHVLYVRFYSENYLVGVTIGGVI